MSTTQHPLTDIDAAEVRNLVEEFGDLIDDVSIWGPSDEVRMLPKLHKIRAALHAALAVAATAEPLARTLLAVPDGYGAPHHDAKEIKPDDFVLQVDRYGTLRGGRVHYQDEDGRWFTDDGLFIAWAARRAHHPDALTVWPAPTPPAAEVEMPGVPCVLTDVQLRGALVAGLALWTGLEVVATGFNGHAAVYPTSDLTAFTLPDGTRVRRDGAHANGEPRFVKAQEADQ